MKSLLKFPLLVAVATMMSCSFSACSDNDDPTPDTGTSETDAKFEAIAKQYLDHTVYVTYKNLADETEQLVKDLQALKSSKTDANVKATCETILESTCMVGKRVKLSCMGQLPISVSTRILTHGLWTWTDYRPH